MEIVTPLGLRLRAWALLTAWAALAFAAPSLSAQTEAPRFYLFRPSDRLEAVLELILEQGDRETGRRQLRLAYEHAGPASRLLAEVQSPASLRNLKFLRISEPGQVNVWVKTSRGLRRLAPGSRPEALFNSDFTSADFDLEPAGWLPEPSGAGTPAGSRWGRSTDSGRQILTVRSDGLILASDYFDAGGRLQRRMQVRAWDKAGPESGYPLEVEVQVLDSGRRSRLRVLSTAEPASWPSATFSPGSL